MTLREFLKDIADAIRDNHPSNMGEPINAQEFAGQIRQMSNEISDEQWNVGFNDGYWGGYDSGYEEGYGNGYIEGKQAEYDKFWETYQSYCETNGYVMAFAGFGWTDDTYNPKRTIASKNSCNQLFYMSKITDTKVTIDVSTSTSNRTAIFGEAKALETIRKIVVVEGNAYSNWFTGCTKLKNITFEGVIGKSIDLKQSTNLTKESIENIVGCLSTTSSGQTLTLSQTAVDNAFTTDEWNTLIANKTNWTISLV